MDMEYPQRDNYIDPIKEFVGLLKDMAGEGLIEIRIEEDGQWLCRVTAKGRASLRASRLGVNS